MKRFATLTVLLMVVSGLAPSTTKAEELPRPGSEGTAETLRRLDHRLDELEKENRAIRSENARLRGQVMPGSPPVAQPPIGMEGSQLIPASRAVLGPPQVITAPPPSPLVSSEPPPKLATGDGNKSPQEKPCAEASSTPGEGVTISMFDNTSKLTLGMTLSGLGIFSTQRPQTPGLPLFLSPASPTGLATNSFDLHARQSTLNARFTGPEFCGLTPGGEVVALFYNDNISTDNYGLLLYYAYGELKNDQVRFAAGLQKDVFNPVGPTILPVSYLYGSGNAGSYRGQIRLERFVHYEDGSQLMFQGAVSEPISTLVRNSLKDPLVEDNGWPNVEGRLAFGVSDIQEFMGGRKQRPVEFGVSGVVGQIRTTRVSPGMPGPIRVVDDIGALGCDMQWAVTDRLGTKAEFFIGQTLGEYNAGVLQNFNTETFRPIRTRGGYGEIYYYLDPKVHLHCGYGIDNPINGDLAPGQIASNQTFFNVLYYDFSKSFQIGLEVDYRKTNYIAPLKDADGVLVMSQFLWRF